MAAPQTEVLITVAGLETGRFVLTPGDYVIGRNEDCPIRVEADLVSRTHARLILNYDHALIEDLGSSNGTQVNGQPIPKDERTRLWPNQKIQVGTATIELRRLKVEVSDMSLAPAQAVVRRVLPEEFLREKKYDIGKVVAQGGMGAILDAREATTERTVAMKVMLDTNDADGLARFLNEAKITAQLEHPNIVPVHELSVDENGQPYYTMKMVRGITLKKVLELMADGTEATLTKYPLPALLTIFQKVCDALAFAHSRGVIHRDLKPENLMLGDYGEVLVMDWGLAKRMTNDECGMTKRNDAPDAGALRHSSSVIRHSAPAEATLAGTIMGTPQFMSPEQARGEVETLDARSDIYSLGAILYQILSLRVPVTGADAMEVVGKVGRGEIEPLDCGGKRQRHAALAGAERRGGAFQGDRAEDPPLASGASQSGVALSLPAALHKRAIPDSLAAVVRKAMMLDREQRYANVADLQRDIAAYQSGFATGAEKAGKWKRFTLLVKRHKAASIGLAAVLVLTIGFMAKVIAEGRRAERGEAKANAALADLKASAPALLKLAESEADTQHFADALRDLDAALALDPALIRARWQRAWVLLGLERWSDAAAALRRAQQHDPSAAKLASILPVFDALAAAPDDAARFTPERTEALFKYLPSVGASGELTALSKRLVLGAKQKQQLIRQRLDDWLGKNVGYAGVRADGTLEVRGLPQTIATLEPLRGLPINRLDVDRSGIKDLEPLRGMPLHTLSLNSCGGVTDLSPLHGMSLRSLNITGTRVADLSALAGMPLTELNAFGSSVEDLTPLRDMPLKTLDVIKTKVRDLAPLKGMPLEFLHISGTAVSDLAPLKGMPLQTLEASDRRGGPVDVSPLRGMPLKRLLVGTVDYSALTGMEFDYLDVGSQANLASLRGIRAAKLRFLIDKQNSLEPLKGVHFKALVLDNARTIHDLSPLRECLEMEEVSINSCPAPVEPLRGHPTLKRIAYSRPGEPPGPLLPVEKFWQEYDAKPK